MPCDFRLDNYKTGRCQLEFADHQLETSSRCVFHCNNTAELDPKSRAEVVQPALEDRIKYFLKKGKPLNLCGAYIPHGVRFNYDDMPEMIFDRVQFFGGEHFKDSKFMREVLFSDCTFLANTSFEGAIFSDGFTLQATLNHQVSLTFVNMQCTADTSFVINSGYQGNKIIFTAAEFSRSLRFKAGNQRFPRTLFDNCRVDGNTDFEGELDSVEIKNSKFGASVRFSGSCKKGVDIVSCEVARNLDCYGFDFGGGHQLTSTCVSGIAIYYNAIFNNSVLLVNCRFENDAIFSVDTTEGRGFPSVSFLGSVFSAQASFTNRIFLGRTDFAQCLFYDAPDFHGATLHQSTRFPLLASFLDTKTSEAPAAYRTLRQLMDRNNCRREEAMFYILEQRSLRYVKGAQGRAENFASTIYDRFSVYGTNFWRPLIWMGIVMFSFGALYAAWARWPLAPLQNMRFNHEALSRGAAALGNGLAFSLEQIVNPFWIWRDPDTDGKSWLRLVATLQSIITTGLFALFFIALRWRFRRD